VAALPVASAGFTNADGETLLDEITRSAVDWAVASSASGTRSCSDLSAVARGAAGYIGDRDALLDAVGQTLCRPALRIVDPIMRRRRVVGAGGHA